MFNISKKRVAIGNIFLFKTTVSYLALFARVPLESFSNPNISWSYLNIFICLNILNASSKVNCKAGAILALSSAPEDLILVSFLVFVIFTTKSLALECSPTT